MTQVTGRRGWIVTVSYVHRYAEFLYSRCDFEDGLWFSGTACTTRREEGACRNVWTLEERRGSRSRRGRNGVAARHKEEEKERCRAEAAALHFGEGSAERWGGFGM